MGERPRILVVDDNAGVREYLRLILRPHHEVALAESGGALRVLSTFRPDLVFVEVKAPSAEALALFQQIKAHDSTVELVVMSVSTMWERLREIFADDPFECLIKPFFPQDVEETVRRAWARRSGIPWSPGSCARDGTQIGDRRRYPRVKVDWAVRLDMQRDGGAQWHGQLRELGPFGMKVMLETQDSGPPSGAIVRFQCAPPDEEAPLSLNGLVWRVDPDGLVLAFVDLSPEEFQRVKNLVDMLLGLPA